MHRPALLVALLFIGTAVAQLPDLPDLGEVPTIPGTPSIPGSPSIPGTPGVGEVLAPLWPSTPPMRVAASSGEPGAPLLEYQQAIWQDGEHAQDVPRDGFDLISLRAWEVDQVDVAAGVVLRLELAGNQLSGADQYIVEGLLEVAESNATPSILVWTEDGVTWQSDDVIIMQNVTPGTAVGILPAPTHHVIHLLVSYERLNASIGQTLEEWAFTAYADSAAGVVKTDVAPGGYYLAAGPELPEPNGAGAIDAESLSDTASAPPDVLLRGPGQHIGISGQWRGGITTLIVTNPYLETNQTVQLGHPAAASPYGETSGLLEANTSLPFQFAVSQRMDAYTVQWEVRSDIGGIAQVEVRVPAIPPPPVEEPEPEPEPEPEEVPLTRTDLVVEPEGEEPAMTQTDTNSPTGGEESPGVGLLGLLAVIAAAFWVAKRK